MGGALPGRRRKPCIGDGAPGRGIGQHGIGHTRGDGWFGVAQSVQDVLKYDPVGQRVMYFEIDRSTAWQSVIDKRPERRTRQIKPLHRASGDVGAQTCPVEGDCNADNLIFQIARRTIGPDIAVISFRRFNQSRLQRH